MHNRLTAPWLAAVLLAAAAPCAPAAEPAAKPDSAAKSDVADTDAARIASRRLKLGLYGRPSPPQTSLQTPRFESSVDVIAARPADPNQTMAVFWRQWNLSTGSIYGKGMNVQNQGCPTCVNILPLIESVVKKIKGK